MLEVSAVAVASSPDEAQRNPGLLCCPRKTRIALRSIRATSWPLALAVHKSIYKRVAETGVRVVAVGVVLSQREFSAIIRR